MCDERRERTDAPREPRVRWSRLYGILAVMAGALTSIEAFGPAGSATMALRGGIALAVFVITAIGRAIRNTQRFIPGKLRAPGHVAEGSSPFFRRGAYVGRHLP